MRILFQRTRLVAVLIGLLFLALPTLANAQSATVRYRSDTGSRLNQLDIYSFTGATNAPVIIYVHGGGWQFGDKSNVHAKAEHFVANGYIFISVNYRMVPDVTVEVILQDIDQAVGWVSNNIRQYGGDGRNLHLMGHSAGAHLVTMTAIVPQREVKPLIASGALRSVISNDMRAYDIPQLAAQGRGGRLPRIYRKVFGEDPARWQSMSPIYHVDTNRQNPPFLILHSGEGDANARAAFAIDFANALGATGTSVTLFDGRNYSHREINVGIGTTPDLTAAIDGFLARYD